MLGKTCYSGLCKRTPKKQWRILASCKIGYQRAKLAAYRPNIALSYLSELKLNIYSMLGGDYPFQLPGTATAEKLNRKVTDKKRKGRPQMIIGGQ